MTSGRDCRRGLSWAAAVGNLTGTAALNWGYSYHGPLDEPVDLVEIPPELGGLSNLTTWFFGLTGEIPPELGGLSNLTGCTSGATS